MEKGEIYDIDIDDVSIDGQGIGRIDGMATFVPGLLPGEKARVRIIKAGKKTAAAVTEERLSDSPIRREAPCLLARACGGCTIQHMTYMGQLQVKDARVRHLLSKVCAGAQINYPLPCPAEFRYRNKTSFPVQQGEGGVKVGCYMKGTHNVVDTGRCLLQTPSMDRCVNAVSRWMQENGIAPYDETTGKGLVRHIVVRRTFYDEIMVGIVTNGRELPCEKELIKEIRSAEDEVMSIVQNVNTTRGNVILGDETRVLFGEPTVRERIMDMDFEISLNTFLQVNHDGCELLYTTVEKLARLLPSQTAVDLYCGAGTISLVLARMCKKVYGIEIVPAAIDDARKNAKENGIENVEFICADSGKGFAEVARRESHIDLVVVDPPRKGLAPEVTDNILKAAPDRVVYVSCDPATLARDLEKLSKEYKAEFVQPVDMFPQTTHVECVVLMSRVEK